MPDIPALIPELKVTGFTRSLDFYCDLCGFDVLYDRTEEEFAMLHREGAQIMIEGMNNSRTWQTGEAEYPLGRGMHLQIRVSNVNELYTRLKDIHYPIYLEMEEKWYRTGATETGHRQFLVQDPDGYLLRFYERLASS